MNHTKRVLGWLQSTRSSAAAHKTGSRVSLVRHLDRAMRPHSPKSSTAPWEPTTPLFPRVFPQCRPPVLTLQLFITSAAGAHGLTPGSRAPFFWLAPPQLSSAVAIDPPLVRPDKPSESQLPALPPPSSPPLPPPRACRPPPPSPLGHLALWRFSAGDKGLPLVQAAKRPARRGRPSTQLAASLQAVPSSLRRSQERRRPPFWRCYQP